MESNDDIETSDSASPPVGISFSDNTRQDDESGLGKREPRIAFQILRVSESHLDENEQEKEQLELSPVNKSNLETASQDSDDDSFPQRQDMPSQSLSQRPRLLNAPSRQVDLSADIVDSKSPICHISTSSGVGDTNVDDHSQVSKQNKQVRSEVTGEDSLGEAGTETATGNILHVSPTTEETISIGKSGSQLLYRESSPNTKHNTQGNSGNNLATDTSPPQSSATSLGITKQRDHRFRIIKVDRSYKRGRWHCEDYTDTDLYVPSSTDSQSIIISTGADDVRATTRLRSCAADTKSDFCMPPLVSERINLFDPRLHSNDEPDNAPKIASTPEIKRAYNDVRNCSSEEEIDAKIEAAMDLMKSHLTNAVREEMSDLRLRIKRLQDRNDLLEREVEMLRKHVSPNVQAEIQASFETELVTTQQQRPK